MFWPFPCSLVFAIPESFVFRLLQLLLRLALVLPVPGLDSICFSKLPSAVAFSRHPTPYSLAASFPPSAGCWAGGSWCPFTCWAPEGWEFFFCYCVESGVNEWRSLCTHTREDAASELKVVVCALHTFVLLFFVESWSHLISPRLPDLGEPHTPGAHDLEWKKKQNQTTISSVLTPSEMKCFSRLLNINNELQLHLQHLAHFP